MDGLAVPGKLKLKKGSGITKKKKKKEKKDEKLTEEIVSAAAEEALTQEKDTSNQPSPAYVTVAPKKTKAEIAFDKRQAELRAERVLKKAKSSHREKVEQFNEKMDSMTEFNDIPKVSWTK